MKTLSSSLDNPNGLSPIQNVMDFDAADSTSLIKITSHKKGRIYRGPNYNAYNRESLGSIPGKQENILVKEGPDGIVGFSSGNSQRFSKENNLSPGPGSYEVNKKVISNKESISSKGYCNGFVSKSHRFDHLKEFYDKFKPGPGQYNYSDSTSLFTEIGRTLNYKHIYVNRDTSSLKIKDDSPGPGEYEIKTSPFKESRKIDFFFNRKPEKFFKLKEDIFPGPGKYYDNKNSEFFISDNQKYTSHFLKRPYYNEKDRYKEEILMKKEIIDKNSSPGVGEYDVGLKLGKVINIRNPQYKVVKLNDFKPKKIETSQKQTNEDYLVKSSFEGKRSFCSIFKSLSPKIVDSVKTDIPGPAYYRDDNIKKINYNYNIDNKWI